MGKGFWKFNNNLLKDTDFIESVNKQFDDVILQYLLPVSDKAAVLTNKYDMQLTVEN